jgi:hypothetical protein
MFIRDLSERTKSQQMDSGLLIKTGANSLGLVRYAVAYSSESELAFPVQSD